MDGVTSERIFGGGGQPKLTQNKDKSLGMRVHEIRGLATSRESAGKCCQESDVPQGVCYRRKRLIMIIIRINK